MADKTYGAEFFAGFVVGGLVGAAVAILLVPQSGEETRALIREKGIVLQERSAEMGNAAADRAKGYGNQAKQKATALQGSMKTAIDQGKAAAGQQKEELIVRVQEDETAVIVEEELPTEE
jgi:gas vesicle protein